MVLSNVESARLMIGIARLRAKAEGLEKQADMDEKNYDANWKWPGKDFIGLPQSIIINRNKAKGMRRKADFLESVQREDAGPEDIPVLEARISDINADIEALQKEKNPLYSKLNLLRYLMKVINGENVDD